MGYVRRTETQEMVLESLRRYLASGPDHFYTKEFKDRFVPREKLVEFMKPLTEFGFVTGMVSEAHGGLALDLLTTTMLVEELTVTSIDLSIPAIINSSAAMFLDQVAPAHLRDRYLPGLLSGESFGSVAITEPDAGSNVVEIKTSARRDGSDWIVSGEKVWISNGMYSDFLICTCRTSDDPKRGLTFVLLDRKEHPYEVRNIEKVAFSGQSTTQIFLNEIRVPAENVIGEVGGALKATLAMFERIRVLVGIQAVGVARRALEEAIRYSTERKQHGKVIAGHQLVAGMLADMAVGVDAARLVAHRAAEMIQDGLPAATEAAMAKYYAAEMAVDVTRKAVQIHGANGISREFLVEKLARDSLIIPIYEGTSQIQQLLIARALTGIGAF